MIYALKRLVLVILLFLPACAVQHQTYGDLTQAPILTDDSFIAADGRSHAMAQEQPAQHEGHGQQHHHLQCGLADALCEVDARDVGGMHECEEE